MRIAIVIERMETWRGGAETSTMELARGLTRRGHEVHLITTTNSQSPPDLTVHSLRPPKVLRALRTVSFARNAADSLERHDFDIIHAISPLPCADTYQPRGGLLAETMKRNVATRPTASRRLMKRAMIAMNVKQRALIDLERKVFQPGGPLILAVSRYVARQCEELYQLGAPRVRVVFNGVTLPALDPNEREDLRRELRAEYHFAEDTLVLLFMAHNFRLKGLYPLLEAASRLAVAGFRRFHLLVVGRDNVVPFQKRVDAMGLNAYVTFTGPTQRVAAFFIAADVCVHPTYYDPCSRVVLEALAFGVPTITTAFNGAAEVIRDGIEGFVIKSPDDVGLWARRIEDLAAPELRAKVSEHARRLGPEISMARHVEELDTIFKEIAERKALRTVDG